MTVKDLIFELARGFDPDDRVVVAVEIWDMDGKGWFTFGEPSTVWMDDNGNAQIAALGDNGRIGDAKSVVTAFRFGPVETENMEEP